nr:unnamed protein product [Spirometra erinaceieuropaei]
MMVWMAIKFGERPVWRSTSDTINSKVFIAIVKDAFGYNGISRRRMDTVILQDNAPVHRSKERKGNRQVCDKHRGISLLNIAEKILDRILLNRLNNHLEQSLLPESQCGFRRHRGTTDMIFAARQLQEKCQEMRTHLYSTFVDLTKAFDKVNREGLWKIMQKFGCPERFTQTLHQLHDGRTVTVHELLFADDCALNTTSDKEMQRGMDLFSDACENLCLVINTQKTVVMHQPPPNSATAPNAPLQISVNGTQLQVVENFPYSRILGSVII